MVTRIGEIAALVGLTTGPSGTTTRCRAASGTGAAPNGYRAYSVRAPSCLARVAGSPDSASASMRCARPRRRCRRRLAKGLEDFTTPTWPARKPTSGSALPAQRPARPARPAPTGPVSPALAALLAQAPRTDSPSAAKDREYLTLMDAPAPVAKRFSRCSEPDRRSRGRRTCLSASTRSPKPPPTIRGSHPWQPT